MQAVGIASCPTMIFYYKLFICSFVPYSYHRLMVAKYGSKREKFQVAKWQATDEQRLVEEMEWVMDVELFLESQAQWAEDSPHCMAIMHEMFQHAAAKEQKEAEWIIHQGHWWNLPQLNPEVGTPTIQLVGQETSKEELLELYLEVYKLHRLPGSPPGKPALFEEVLSFLKDHQGWRGNGHLQPWQGPIKKTSIPWEAASPRREIETAQWREVWPMYVRPTKMLAVAAALKEEIERLSCTQNCQEMRARS